MADSIENAIAAFSADRNQDSMIGVLEAIRERMHADGHFLIPVILDEKDKNRFAFRTLTLRDGKNWNVVFTSKAEYEKTKIEFLENLAKGWFGNSQQHSIQAQILARRGFGKLTDKIMAESDEEWNEAKKVNARLIELGVTPKVELSEYPVFTDAKEMLEYDCKDAAEALPEMSKHWHFLRMTM